MSRLPPRVINPMPRDCTWLPGQYRVPERVRLGLSSGVDAACVDWMTGLWRRFTCERSAIEVVPTATGGWHWSLAERASPPVPALPAGEAYALDVGDHGAAASAADAAGLRHAWSTFLQLVGHRADAAVTLPQVRIVDRPALRIRMLHLCVFPETRRLWLTQAIVLAGMLKYTHVIVEFWGTLRHPCLKELAWPQAWTQAEAQELFALIRQQGMEPVPMFNIWGHATQSRIARGRHVVLDQNPSLAALFEPDGWTWCLSHPRVRDLIGEAVAFLCACAGPGSLCHIGCDEAHSHATCDTCRDSDAVELLAGHINGVAGRLRTLGRRAIMWGDALLDEEAWKPPVVATSSAWNRTHPVVDRLDRSIIIADWHYDIFSGDFPTIAHFHRLGFQTLACPWSDPRNIRVAARTAQAENALGLMLTTWDRQDSLRALPTAAQLAWPAVPREDDPLLHYAVIAAHAATLMRSAMPGPRTYAEAGWTAGEI